MAAISKRYVIYDLNEKTYTRTDTASDDVAFNSVAIGGVGGPTMVATSGAFDFNGAKLINAAIYDEPVKNVSGSAITAGQVLRVSAVGATTDVMLASAQNTINNATTFCIAKSGAANGGTLNAYLRSGAMVSGLPVSSSVSFTSSAVDTTNDWITIASHGMANGCPIIFTGSVPSGLTANTLYYVVNKTLNTFQLAATVGGSFIDLTTQGLGTMYAIHSGGGSLTVSSSVYLSKIAGEVIADVSGYAVGDCLVSLGTFSNNDLVFAPRFIIKL